MADGLSRRTLLKTGAATLGSLSAGGLLAACGGESDEGGGESSGRLKMKFQLDFTPLGRFAPFYYGMESGIYAKRNLDVSIASSSGSGPALQQLATGNAEFLLDDLAQMLKLMGKTSKPHMRAYGSIFSKASQTIFFFEDGPISQPKDLEGKTIATSAGSNEFLLFPVFAKANGIDASKVKWKTVDPTVKTTLLLQGEVDATSTTIFGLAGLEAGAKEGQKIAYFTYGDYGVKTQGASLITTDDFAKRHPEAVPGFVQGSMEAIEASFKNPQAAIDAMAKHVKILKKDIATRELELLPGIVKDTYQKRHGIGQQDAGRVKSTYELVTTVLEQPVAAPYTDFFTNDALAT